MQTQNESFTHDGDRTGLDGDEHVDECRHRTRAFHTIQLVKPRRLVDTNGFHHDFEKTGNETCAGSGLRLVQDGSQSGSCCPFVETENEIHVEERYEPAWLGARRSVAQCGCRDADGLGDLECDGAFACGNGDGSQKSGNQRDVSDRNGTQITPVEKEENRTAPRANRVEFALPSNLEKAESAEARETPEQDRGECRDGKAPKKTQSKHFNWSSIAKHENPESVLTNFFQEPYSIPTNQEEATQSDRRHWVELWKNLRVDCGGGMLISPKKLENVLKKLKNGKGSPDQITADVLKALPPECLEKLARSLSLMCFPRRLAVLYDGNGSESGGCNVLDEVQAYCWAVCDAKSLGLRMAQLAPSTAVRECADCACAEDTCRCWFVFAAESGGTVSRVAERLWWCSWT